MSLGQMLRKRRKEMGLTLDEVAWETGFSKPYLSTIETGYVDNPPSLALLEELERLLKFKKGYLVRVANLERIPPDLRKDIAAVDAENRKYRQLLRNIVKHKVTVAKARKMLSNQDLELEPVRKSSLRAGGWVPVINRVSAGYPSDFTDMDYPVGFADDYVRAPDLHDPNGFAVRVVGDSMEPKYKEGDIVIFSPAARVESGDDCFVRFKNPHETTFKRVFFDVRGKIRLQPRNEEYRSKTISKKRVSGIYRAVIKYENL